MSKKRTPINPDSIERLKRMMAELNVNQSQLSKEIGIHKNTMSKMIQGKAPLTTTIAKLVEKRFPEYSYSYLMGETEYKNETEHHNRIVNDIYNQLTSSNEMIFSLIQMEVNAFGYKIEEIPRTDGNPTPTYKLEGKSGDNFIMESSIAFQIKRYIHLEALNLMEGAKDNGKPD